MAAKTLKDQLNEKRAREATKRVCASPSCFKKGDPQALTQYYRSNSGTMDFYPLCKTCVSAIIDPENLDTVYPVLRDMNIAFVPEIWYRTLGKVDVSLRSTVFGKYLKALNLSSYKGDGYSETQKVTKEEAKSIMESLQEKWANEEQIAVEKEEKETGVTSKMVEFFGDGWKTEEYEYMSELLAKITVNYPGKTFLHELALKNYIIANMQYVRAVQSGSVDEAKKWNDMMAKAAIDAKITPKQLTKADLQGGLNSFSELIQAVEQAVDVIPILPKFQMQPRDVPDFILWCYIDYERASAGKPSPTYSDIYKFYDQRVEEYIRTTGDPEGLFNFKVKPEMRKVIEDYIDLDK